MIVIFKHQDSDCCTNLSASLISLFVYLPPAYDFFSAPLPFNLPAILLFPFVTALPTLAAKPAPLVTAPNGINPVPTVVAILPANRYGLFEITLPAEPQSPANTCSVALLNIDLVL